MSFHTEMPVADCVVVVMIRGLPLIQPNCFVILSSLLFRFLGHLDLSCCSTIPFVEQVFYVEPS
jgi:hypothetical protein